MKKFFLKTVFIFLLISLQEVTSAQTPSSWIARGMGGGGAVYSPSISPFNLNEAYLGCDMSLMSHTLDFGNTWRTISFDTLMGQRHTKVNFTNHPDTMYVESLDKYSSRNWPVISVNGGVTWSVIPNTAFWGTFGSFRLFANPFNSKQVIASSYTNVYFSNNWGASFTSIHNATAQGASFIHLAGVLFTNDTIFVSTDKGLIISPNNGTLWNVFVNYNTMGITTGAGNEAVASFGGAVYNNQTRFFCTTVAANNLTVKTEPRDIQYFQKLYRLNYNSSGTWSDITSNLKNADATLNNYNYAYQVTMNYNCIDTLYLTGQTRSPATSTGSKFGTVFKTTDGGNSFSNVFLKNSNPTNANMTTGWMGAWSPSPFSQTWVGINTTEGLCIDPNNISRLMRSDFSMVCISEDGGATWDQRYLKAVEHPPLTLINKNDLYETSGLQTTVCHWMHWLSPSRVLAAYSDVLLHESNDSGRTWGFLFDSLWSQKVNDIEMLCQSPSGRLYAPEGETLGNNGDWSDYRLSITHAGKIMYSDDANHWHLLKNFSAPVSWAAFDPNDSTTMYVTVLSELADTVGGIWKCTGLPSSPVWTKLISPTRTQRRPTQIFVLNNGDLLAVYGARDSSTTQPVSFSFQASSGVFLSSDGGNTWTDLCATYSAMQKDVRFLTIDPNDASQNTWLIGVGSSGTGSLQGLYRTTTRGATWQNVWSGKTVLTCTFNPITPSEMYVCTANEGLFYATSANTNTPTVTQIKSYPFKAPERVFFNPYNPNEVWITSWGNGLRVGNTILSSIPLPVQLISFTGYNKNKNNYLTWSTATENQNSKFEIERSGNAKTFFKIGEISSQTNSNSTKNYSFIDYEVPLGINYYRLRQIDFNGDDEYSKTICIHNPENGFEVEVYPNPGSTINYQMYSSKNMSFEIEISNVTGEIVYQKNNKNSVEGIREQSIDVSFLRNGIYFISFESDGNCKRIKWVKEF